MSDIDWNENAKAAVRAYGRKVGDMPEAVNVTIEELATRPAERKTVKDAVDDHNFTWPFPRGDKLYFHEARGKYMCLSKSLDESQGYYFVCTREGFEAEVKRREVELPIVFGFGANVPLSFVVQDGTKYELNDCSGDRAEYYKVKPTISKAEAFDKLNGVPGITLEELHEQFNVEDAA